MRLSHRQWYQLALLWFMSIGVISALVPHTFWSDDRTLRGRGSMAIRRDRRKHRSAETLRKLYFDDCERVYAEEWEACKPVAPFSKGRRSSWIMSNSQEKQQAIEKLLGYSPESASKLTVREVEEGTLQWAADCNILSLGNGENDDYEDGNEQIKATKGRYDSISDLLVAEECAGVADSLAYLWKLVARLLDNQERNSVYLVVFPKASALWEYDTMVTLLQALAISKPLLPADMQYFQLDLFHPDYKHSPRMWSPELHSPFPTVGVSFRGKPVVRQGAVPKEELSLEEELEVARSSLESLFDRVDADDNVNVVPSEVFEKETVPEESRRWATDCEANDDGSTTTWEFEPHSEPFWIYASLWAAINRLHQTPAQSPNRTMLVVPYLDAHTTERLAVTVNAALQKLRLPVRITNVYHPKASSESRRSPHAMIQAQRLADS